MNSSLANDSVEAASIKKELGAAAIGISLFSCVAVFVAVGYFAFLDYSLITEGKMTVKDRLVTPSVLVALITASVAQWGIVLAAASASVFVKQRRSFKEMLVGKPS